MHAITVDSFTETPAMHDIEIPTAGPGHLLIKVHTAGMNPMDLHIAAGGFEQRAPATFPLVLGSDVVGEVVTLGSGATGYAVGDRVFGQLLVAPLGSAGAFAEYVSVPDTAPLAKVPDGLSETVAAALPTPAVTAWQIAASLGVVTDTRVVIVGAAGGVGSILTQLVAQRGGIVTATARETDRERLLRYGAAATIDHTAGPLVPALRASLPDGFDTLVDLADDAEAFATVAALVRSGGTAISTRYAADTAHLADAGITGTNFEADVTAADLALVATEVAAGRLEVPPLTTIAFDGAVGLLGPHDDAPSRKTIIAIN